MPGKQPMLREDRREARGEALALKWDDLDLERRELRVERAASTTGDLGTPKSGHGRTLNLSRSACDVLRALRRRVRW